MPSSRSRLSVQLRTPAEARAGRAQKPRSTRCPTEKWESALRGTAPPSCCVQFPQATRRPNQRSAKAGAGAATPRPLPVLLQTLESSRGRLAGCHASTRVLRGDPGLPSVAGAIWSCQRSCCRRLLRSPASPLSGCEECTVPPAILQGCVMVIESSPCSLIFCQGPEPEPGSQGI